MNPTRSRLPRADLGATAMVRADLNVAGASFESLASWLVGWLDILVIVSVDSGGRLWETLTSTESASCVGTTKGCNNIKRRSGGEPL